jgi:hypothetical protein
LITRGTSNRDINSHYATFDWSAENWTVINNSLTGNFNLTQLERVIGALLRIPGHVDEGFRQNVNKDSGDVNRGFREKVNGKMSLVGKIIHMSE